MSDDFELAALLGEPPKQPDPAFRVDVLARVTAGARRRAALLRGAKQVGALTLVGLVFPIAQALGLGSAQLQPVVLALAAVGLAYGLALVTIRGPRAVLGRSHPVLRVRA
jgi:hypothetical protein